MGKLKPKVLIEVVDDQLTKITDSAQISLGFAWVTSV